MLNCGTLDLIGMSDCRLTYSIWWVICDKHPNLVYRCEIIIKDLSQASKLKNDCLYLI